MKKKPERLRVREIEVERLIVREPRDGRARAVIETVPTRAGRSARVRLTLLAPDGEPILVADVDHRGQPRLSIGNPHHGHSVIITRAAVDAWSKGNIVASLRSDKGRGVVEVLDDAARGLTPVRPPRKT